MIEANNPTLKSFIDIPADHHFPIQNLPFGIFSTQGTQPRAGVAIGDYVLDLAVLERNGFFSEINLGATTVFNQTTLNAFMTLGRPVATQVRNKISQLLRHDNPTLRDDDNLKATALIISSDVTMHLPIHVNGYTDFYSSIEHATNIGTMFRDKDNPLLPNWRHLPVAYDGRAGSVVVSGTDFHRPMGQVKPNADEPPVYAPCRLMDTEVEVAMVIGQPSQHGDTVSMSQAPDYIFGLVLLSDWSARDIQKWEYVPLGPFLGKNFCTSISAWIVTLDALEPFRIESPKQDPIPLDYLKREANWGIDINLSMGIQTTEMKTPETVAKMNFGMMYWDMCQQLTHHSMGGCPMRTGDLLASGTISGAEKGTYGSLIELTWGGKEPLQLQNGETRKFMQDFDNIVISGFCQGEGYIVGFGEVSGRVLPVK